MSTTIVFAGGDGLPKGLLQDLPKPDRVIAANGGYGQAVELGFRVDVLVGDFDSLSPEYPVPDHVELVPHPVAKDSTDLELAFELAAMAQPQRIVLVGAEGGRFDHELGAIAVLASPRWSSVPEIEWARTTAHVYVVRGTIRIQGDLGATLSMLAVGGDASGVSTKGLIWPLKGETLYWGSSRGVSNRFSRPEATIRVEHGTLLAIVPESI